MSGGWLPYHLRRNKAVDRAIFMEFLSKLNSYRQLSNYGYIGFGAIHMEDFKLIHSLFAIRNLVCLEMDELIFNRQKFNAPLGCIKLENKSSSNFFEDYYPESNVIVWLDYASPKEIGEQIKEFQALLPKLQEFDVVKITLNANPNCLVDHKEYYLEKKVQKLKGNLEELNQNRFNILQERVNNNLPYGIEPKLMTRRYYPIVLLKILEYSSCLALEGQEDLIFKPVLSFVYADSSQQMLTLTGIVINRANENTLIQSLGLDSWEFTLSDWYSPQLIDLPDLTLKERLVLDSMLPCDNVDLIINQLSIQFDEDFNKSREKIMNYLRYYRHYPFFTRVSV